MTFKNPEEVTRDYSEFFGKKDGAIVHRLTVAVSQLYHEWGLFLYFFCGPKERIDTLNQASGKTTRVLQRALWDGAVLKVRALTDPRKQGGNENLSLEQLVRIAERFERHSLGPALEETKDRTKVCRGYADKYLAHKDYHHSIGQKVTRLTAKDTTEAIEAMGAFVQKFHQEVLEKDIVLAPIVRAPTQESFLAHLHYGAIHSQNLKAQKDEDIKARRYRSPDDYSWPDWINASELKKTKFKF